MGDTMSYEWNKPAGSKFGRVRKAIACKCNKRTNDQQPSLTSLGISRSESAAMRRVMEETNGDGGPWFYRHAIMSGLINS